MTLPLSHVSMSVIVALITGANQEASNEATSPSATAVDDADRYAEQLSIRFNTHFIA